jgi:hypothetical protein
LHAVYDGQLKMGFTEVAEVQGEVLHKQRVARAGHVMFSSALDMTRTSIDTSSAVRNAQWRSKRHLWDW